MKQAAERLKQAVGAGIFLTDEPMSRHTTFRTGGPADIYIEPSGVEELKQVLDICREENVAYTIIGNGSNLLVGDGGYRGVLISFGKPFAQVTIEGAQVRTGAGALLSAVAKQVLNASLTGFEFAAGIPGTIGGAVVMNAGAYGGELCQVLREATVLTPEGEVKTLPAEELELYKSRSQNYRNLFDPETKLMRGKNADGTFQTPFNPFKWGDAFTEGNSWHYSWSVFHDPQGLIDLMGGKEMFVTMLDSVFSVPPIFDDSYYGQVIHEIREMTVMNMGNYAHGNQPIQHMIYLYNYAGEPWKAQYWLRQVMNRMYTAGPDGYCGDEDNGQTSAWYVFSALGFYPVCPGTDEYVLGAPLFRKATLHFENGKSLTIDAPDNSPENMYIESLKVNGVDYSRNYLTHGDLLNGGTLRFDMGSQPNMKRGTQPEDYPYSFSNELKK